MYVGLYRRSVGTMTTNLLNTAGRIDLAKTSPEFFEAMMTLSSAANRGVEPEIGELIKIRASQLNHCAFCLDMHLKDARRIGVDEQKLDLLAAWREVQELYTERERAALDLAEAITDLGDGHVPDAVYQRAAAVFTEAELAQVIAMAVTINSWNRINVSVRTQPPAR
jgi:AhpD family alkylhydroperoxidase